VANEYSNLDDLDRALRVDCGDLADDPLEWVYFAYPWGQGELAGYDGPDEWQRKYLADWGRAIRARDFDGSGPVMPYMTSTVSGHGVGKSALVAWIVDFIMSTRPGCKGRVTANSIPQLETTTWPEIVKWSKLMVTRRWFRITSGRGAMKMVAKADPEGWTVRGMAWDQHRAAAFAGVHAAQSMPFYIFDEASEIARIILETAQGGLTDGEPFLAMFSNPTKPVGFFYDSHHSMRQRYTTYNIDSRSAKMPNQALIKQWIEDWGLDSDFVKVRVLGEFPLTGDRQMIPGNLVDMAMSADRTPTCGITDPIICGVDVARYGDDESVIKIRRGRDGRSMPCIVFRGIDNYQLALEIRKLNERFAFDAINVDSGGGSGIIDPLRNWNVPNVNEILFGGTSPDPEFHLMNTYMMAETRKWLKLDGVTLEDDPVLKRQLKIRRYSMIEGKKGTAVKIETKEEMKEDADIKESPDRADALGLTFAVPVGPRNEARTRAIMAGEGRGNVIGVDYERT
jgi:hypothetical protein